MFNIKIGILNLSNPLTRPLDDLIDWLQAEGFQIAVSPYLYDQQASPAQKAAVFNAWMRENVFDFVFDVSGGDLANTTIPYLDVEAYRQAKTVFAGYSDLTCVLNVLCVQRPVVLYQLRNHGRQRELIDWLRKENEDLLVQKGVYGGNIRCLLKLAGTGRFPDLTQKTLLLESFSGSSQRIESDFAQLAMMGVFTKIRALVLGRFTELFQSRDGRVELERIARQYYLGPIRFDDRIGHQYDAFAAVLGES